MLIEYNASLSARTSSPLGSGRASGAGPEGGVAGGGPGPSLLSPMGGGTGSSLLSPVGCSTPQSTLSDAVLMGPASSSTNTSSSSIAAVSGPLESLFIGSDGAGAVGAAGGAAATGGSGGGDGAAAVGVAAGGGVSGGGGGISESRSGDGVSSIAAVVEGGGGVMKSRSATQPTLQNSSSAAAVLIRARGKPHFAALYCKARQATVASAVESVSMKEYTAEETQAMAWADLEPLIKLWIRDISILLRVLFFSEHQLIKGALKANDSTTHSTSQSTPENAPEGPPESPPEDKPEGRSKCAEQAARKPGEHLMSPDSVLRHLVGSVGGVKSTLCVLCANAAAIAASKSAPEKIFALLEAYRTVADLSPQALPVFLALPKSDSDDPFKLWQRLSQLFAGAIFATLDDLNRILRDVSAFVPANQASGSSPMKKKLLRLIHWKSSEQKATNEEEVDIGVHKVTSYVINFIAQLMDRESRSGSQTSQGSQGGGQAGQGGSQGGNQLQHPSAGGRRQLAAEMEGLLDSLLFNMEARGRAIQDPAMGALFVMNNAHYVAGSIVATRMKDALKQQDRIAAYEAAFDKAGLAKLMACLAPEEVSAKLSADAVKSRLKKFNSAFEEVALEQNRWIVISDSQRKKTRIRFARTLKNAYLEFLTPHREIIADIPTYQWSPDGIERLMLKSFFLEPPAFSFPVKAWEAAYGLQADSPLPPSAIALPPRVPPPPHLEDCAVLTAWRWAQEHGEAGGAGGQGETGEPGEVGEGWETGGAREAEKAGGGGEENRGESGEEGKVGEGKGGRSGEGSQVSGGRGKLPPWAAQAHPQPPWIVGSDAANLAMTRVAQRDIWAHQFPPGGDCSNKRLLLVDWPSSAHGIGSQLHIMSAILSVAMRFKRVLVPSRGSFTRASHPDCNGEFHRHIRLLPLLLLPLVSPACEREAELAAVAAAAANETLPRVTEESKEAVLASDQRVVLFHREPYNGLRFEGDVSRWPNAYRERPNTIELVGFVGEGDDTRQRVHWWRAQSIRFLLRSPSVYLCHITNRVRHTSYGLSVAAHLAASAAQQAALARTHPNILSSLSAAAPPCIGGDGSSNLFGAAVGDIRTNSSSSERVFYESSKRSDAGNPNSSSGSSGSHSTGNTDGGNPADNPKLMGGFPVLDSVLNGCTLESRAWAERRRTAAHSSCTCSSTDSTSATNTTVSGAPGITDSRSLNYRRLILGIEPYVPRPIVSMHVRQGDKGSEMQLNSFAAFMFFTYRLRRADPDVKHVWLSTEMQSVIDQANQFKDWSFLYSHNPRQSSNKHMVDYERDVGHQLVGISFANLIISSQCDYFVGALGSNWNRLINELRVTNGRLFKGYVTLNNDEF
ncbi:unnamed protein product [Closterium sp. Yama58-4]|nr:unnamed protein product [Closterium sp. Yama58-4]